tara:strand:+ start:66 stop:821 length:756 start_codon:yes stop_codon:yes gene_type:complete
MIFKSNQHFSIGFIICGSQKGGTTALDYYLRLHQDICMAKKKEVHFFDNDKYFLKGKIKYNDYHKYFNPKLNHKIIGEATPIYMFWNKAMQRIYDYNPNMKLIIILRNPIDRAFSNWNMERQRRREKRTFWDSIQDELKNINEIKQNRTVAYLRRGLYSDQIKNIFQIFNKNQLLCLKNENLKNKPGKTLDIISNFLNISKFRNIKKINIHSRVYENTLSLKEREFLKSFFLKDMNTLENLLGWDLSNWKN